MAASSLHGLLAEMGRIVGKKRVLSDPAVSHLVVCQRADAPPQGVVSEIDLVRVASA